MMDVLQFSFKYAILGYLKTQKEWKKAIGVKILLKIVFKKIINKFWRSYK